MKVSEAIDRLEVGETVWVKARVDRINCEGRYIKAMTNASSVYLDGHDEISLAEPTPIDALAQEYDVEPETIREWLDKGHKGSFEKVVVPEKVEAHLAEHWNEDIGDVLWWNFPVDEPPYCGTPLDERFPKYKTHFTTIDMPNEIEKPKRWVVKFNDAETDFYFMGWSDIYKTDDNPSVPNGYVEKDKGRVFIFTEKSKAEAVAVLVEGSVEEV